MAIAMGITGLFFVALPAFAIITGRYAPQELIGCADLVTEMNTVKYHYHDQGIKAQQGIEL